ncbi:MAG TPA: RHS repeat-associated core domain-containing protein [Fibrobacteria bacterium]|nr:RHS repeat-associated core domain-containing protein [Fibrobacteria bacterium]
MGSRGPVGPKHVHEQVKPLLDVQGELRKLLSGSVPNGHQVLHSCEYTPKWGICQGGASPPGWGGGGRPGSSQGLGLEPGRARKMEHGRGRRTPPVPRPRSTKWTGAVAPCDSCAPGAAGPWGARRERDEALNARPRKPAGRPGETGAVWPLGYAAGRQGRRDGATPPGGGWRLPWSGMGGASTFESRVKTVAAPPPGYVLAPSGDLFPSPFFLLAATPHPRKSAYGPIFSDRHTRVTGKSTLSPDPAPGCGGGVAESRVGPNSTGKEFEDATGLYYFGARWMDPELGMFLSPDPAGQYFNSFAFGPGDPINGIDPSGMVWDVFRPSKWGNFFSDAGGLIYRETGEITDKADRWAGGFGEGDEDNILRRMYRAMTGRNSNPNCAPSDGDPEEYRCAESTRGGGPAIGVGTVCDQEGNCQTTVKIGDNPEIGPGSEMVKRAEAERKAEASESQAQDAINRVVAAENRVRQGVADEFDYLRLNPSFQYSRDIGAPIGRGVGHFVELAVPIPIGIPIKVGGRAIEYLGGRISESGFLKAAEQYLGKSYIEKSPGRWVSGDGLRQVRFGAHEVKSKPLHGHFEAYDKAGGHIIENTRVEIIPY